MKYIIEICVAIDLAILGIAYPIIINEINKIGEKYKSNYLLEIFKTETPQRNINWSEKIISYVPSYFSTISRFKFYLIITIISFIFLILNLQPLFGLDFWLINNSAELLVLLLTIVLVFNFILWLDIVALYNGKTIKILQHLISIFKRNGWDSEISKYCLMAINEFTFYSIRNQDAHIQYELLQFYYYVFDKEREAYKKSIEILETDSIDIRKEKQKLKEQGIQYSTELYDLIFTINLELNQTENVFVKAIEHKATSGWWLYGSGYEEVTISKRTYEIIWSILKLSISKPHVIKSYWAKAHQYFRMGLDYVRSEYEDGSMVVTNEDEINFRIAERDKYLEFHYTLGGLLVYMEEYKTLKYVLTFSQSSPPDYVLLPQSMTDIFKWYDEFRNDNNWRLERLETSYSYPELDNYGVSSQIKFWVCQYLNILFIRQFSLVEFMTYHDHTGKPVLPNNVIDLRSWADSVSHFEFSYKKLLENNKVFEVLGYEQLLSEKGEEIKTYIQELKADIISKIEYVEENKALSQDKISAFLVSSEQIIKKGFQDYESVINPYDIGTIYDDVKLTISGSRNIMTKAAFVDEEIPHMNFDDILAQGIVHNHIKYFFPTSFAVSATNKYLFRPNLINDSIRRAIGKAKDYVIIGFNIDYKFKDQILAEFAETKFLFCSQYRFKNALFVLKHSDLPVIIKKTPLDDVIKKYKLKPTSDGSSIFGSVLDLGLEENKAVKDEFLQSETEETIKNKVQVMVWMLWLILWKKDRQIIQIGIDTRDEEQGIRSTIDEIEPLH